MAEEVSPESKLYVKEEIEKTRIEFKDDLEKAQSRATRTFTTIAMVVGLLAGVGVWSSTILYVKDRMSNTTIAKLEADASTYASDANTYASDASTYVERAEGHLKDILRLKKIANLPIGTIVASMLAPDKFAAEVGDPNVFDANESGWVLADGQKDITTSRYGQLSGETKTPDLRGVFLRGMNVNGGQDPNDRREAGDPQADALQQHGHVTNAFQWDWNKRPKGPTGYTSDARAKNAHPANVTNVVSLTGEKINVDNETRPKNVAVYFYIKIN